MKGTAIEKSRRLRVLVDFPGGQLPVDRHGDCSAIL
jgi:hypothetical protein